MQSFAAAFPGLASDLAAELRASGRADLARELEASAVRDITFDAEADAGLIVLEPTRALNAVERNVIGRKLGQVIPFSGARYASLQLDNFGRVVALEFAGPPAALATLLRLTSNNRSRVP